MICPSHHVAKSCSAKRCTLKDENNIKHQVRDITGKKDNAMLENKFFGKVTIHQFTYSKCV